MKIKKAKKFHKIITSEEYQNGVFEIVSQFPEEKDKFRLSRYLMSEKNVDVIFPLYKYCIKNQLTDSEIKFFAIKIYQIVKSN